MDDNYFISIIILVIGFVLLYILFFHIRKKYLIRRYHPVDYKFMYEFLEITGCINKKDVRKYSDDSHKIDRLEKLFIINGVDCYTEKIFQGKNIKRELSEGVKIFIIGGSSASFDSLGIETYDITDEKMYKTRSVLIEELERSKSILIPFVKPIKTDGKFKIKYIEGHWYGSMRCDYDGIICNEHIFF